MITNLVFKRTVNIEGSQKTEMKIIKVKIDGIKSSEGWSLVSSADTCTFDDQSGISDHGISIDKFPEVVLCVDAPTKAEIDKEIEHGLAAYEAKYEKIKEFYTNIAGTAFDFWNKWMDEIYQEDRTNSIKLMKFQESRKDDSSKK